MSTVLDASKLYRFYHAGGEETLALQGVSLNVDAGEMVAVVGPSGSGKSTLLACLAGLDDPDGGTVRVVGKRMTRTGEPVRALLRSRHIGVLLQGHNLVDHLTVRDNIALAQAIRGRANQPPAGDILAQLGIAELASAMPGTLSGGEVARAGLAVALANGPELLLADEPTGELDETSERTVIDLLTDLTDAGTAVLVVTHSDAVAAAAGRVVALRDGRIES